MDFEIEGKLKHFIQIGTVMTDETYRNQGLSRYLMEKILEEWQDKVDGIYLFANPTVLDFYPKFGFRAQKEYQCSKHLELEPGGLGKGAIKVDMTSQFNQQKVVRYLEKAYANAPIYMRNNIGLSMFYMGGFMKDLVYYIEEEDAFVVADLQEQSLVLYEMIAPKKVSIEKLITAFGETPIKEVVLHFTPYDKESYIQTEFKEEDTTLFVLGNDLEALCQEGIMFPALSHA